MKKTNGVWFVIAIIISYALSLLISIFAELTGTLTFAPISFAVNTLGVVLMLIAIYKLYFIKKSLFLWLNLVFIFALSVKVITLFMFLQLNPSSTAAIYNSFFKYAFFVVILWVVSYRTVKQFTLRSSQNSESKQESITLRILGMLVVILFGVIPQLMATYYLPRLIENMKKNNSPITTSPTVVVSQSNSVPTPGVLIIVLNWNLSQADMDKVLVKYGATNCKKNWPNENWSYLCSVKPGSEQSIIDAVKIDKNLDRVERWYGNLDGTTKQSN